MKAFDTEKLKGKIPATVLVVEDNKGLNHLIQKKLQRAGFKTEGVFNGSDTIAKVVESPNLILLLDYILPDMTGRKLIKTLFKQECSVPFMVMTGYGDEKIAVEMMKLGARDYIIKDPDFIDVLPQILKRIFENLDKEKRLITAEEELRKAKVFAESIVSSAMDGIIVIDFNGDFVQFNNAFLKMMGYSNEAFENMNIRQLTPEKWLVEDAAQFKKLLLEGATCAHYDKELIKKDGSVFPVALSVSLLNDEEDKPIAMVGIIRDETERKKAGQALRESEEEKRLVLENMSDLIVYRNKKMETVWASKSLADWLGCTNDTILGRVCYNARYGLDKPCKDCWVINTLETGKSIEQERKSPGGRVWFVKTNPVYNDTGEIIGTVEVSQDITERKQAEEALRESEEKMRTILDSMPDVVLQLDTNLEITWANKATLKLNPHAIGQFCYKALPGRNDECPGCPIIKTLKTGKIKRGIVHLQSVKGVGESYWDDVGIPIKDTQGKITSIVKLTRNITERKKAEEELKKLYTELKESQAQLIQLEKMSAVGTLVAGVAHELNNPITAILHFTQYCIKHTSKEDRLYTILQDIEKATRSCIDTTQNLLTFSHMQRGEVIYQKESLNTILSRVLKLLFYRIKKDNISVSKNISIGVPDIPVNVINVQQVFLNLFNNALDALKESKQKKIDIDILRKGKYVEVIIADSGCGIVPEDIDNIFDPFFTTKPVGKGTGLGLSLCQSIIKAHNGEIICESVPGQGTKFKILLPVNGKKVR